MNIFEIYLEKIKSILSELQKDNKIIVPDNFNGINAEIPPQKFNCDISTNVAMFLAMSNFRELFQQALSVSTLVPFKRSSAGGDKMQPTCCS